jgi:hypothetical protein
VVPRPSRPPYELINGKCFYLLSEQYTKEGAPLALDIDINSIYAAWSLYNARIVPFKGSKSNVKSQQFMWNAINNRIESYVVPDGFLKEGGNHNVIVYNSGKGHYNDAERFVYDLSRKALVSVYTENVLDITNDKFVED